MSWLTAAQLAPSVLIWMWLSLPPAPRRSELVPLTFSIVSEVTKSVLDSPVSASMPVIFTALLAGASVITVTSRLSVSPGFPATSTTRAV
ncbi:hypothetical protein H8R02_28435 [Ramlibacter sp. GTP1]|uniref:Uncharacterized protein n=1 Tax=Ramlibacter albus TaxID=2079448 RepID=A0A923MG97_9BURK|nr:hypothetical protein [Ramlibacter albus]MBC5768422.1 hypothetical protein [Ramlibacter albus]